MMLRLIFIASIFILLCGKTIAQENEMRDTVLIEESSTPVIIQEHLITGDTIIPAVKKAPKPHSVKRAVSLSAVVPGMGQVYNKKWWKVPIIYAGFGGLGISIGFNTKNFRTYRDAFRMRVDGDSTTVDSYGNYTDDQLLTLKNFYQRNMNVAIIFTAVLYALNIVDAAVDAHLFEFDISDDLTLRVDPVMQFSGGARGNFTGLNLTMRF